MFLPANESRTCSSSGVVDEVQLMSMSAAIPASGSKMQHGSTPAMAHTIIRYEKSMPSAAVVHTVSEKITLILVSIAKDTNITSKPSGGHSDPDGHSNPQDPGL